MQAGVYDEADVRDGDRRLGDVGREHDLAVPGRGREHRGLLLLLRNHRVQHADLPDRRSVAAAATKRRSRRGVLVGEG